MIPSSRGSVFREHGLYSYSGCVFLRLDSLFSFSSVLFIDFVDLGRNGRRALGVRRRMYSVMSWKIKLGVILSKNDFLGLSGDVTLRNLK